MSRNSNNRSKNSPRNGEGRPGRRRGGRGGGAKKSFSECPLCGKGVRDLLTAIAWGEERKPTHFDCILKSLSEQETLEPKEKLIYLGAGNFGIVKFRSGSGPNPRFTVRKRIPMEEKEEKIEWRRQISRKIR